MVQTQLPGNGFPVHFAGPCPSEYTSESILSTAKWPVFSGHAVAVYFKMSELRTLCPPKWPGGDDAAKNPFSRSIMRRSVRPF